MQAQLDFCRILQEPDWLAVGNWVVVQMLVMPEITHGVTQGASLDLFVLHV